MVCKKKRHFDSSLFAASRGGCALSSGWPAEQGFIEFSTDTEVSDIM